MPERAAARTAAAERRWPERVALRDGSEIAIRPIRKSDKKRLLEGFQHLSPESRYRRFLVPMPRLSPRLVRYFTEIDHHDHEALVALGWESREPIGVARFVRSEENGETAEVAVAVVDHWQGHGVATELLKRLAVRAHEEGITCFTATCLAENHEILDLFDSLGSTEILRSDSGLVEARIDLPAQEEAGMRAVLRAAATRRLVFRPPASRLAEEVGKLDWPPRRR
jgi:RimJ/RimL family protein N-acetyltransferase